MEASGWSRTFTDAYYGHIWADKHLCDESQSVFGVIRAIGNEPTLLRSDLPSRTAEIASTTILNSLTTRRSKDMARDLELAFMEAHHAVRNHAVSEFGSRFYGMASALVATVDANRLAVAHVGGCHGFAFEGAISAFTEPQTAIWYARQSGTALPNPDSDIVRTVLVNRLGMRFDEFRSPGVIPDQLRIDFVELEVKPNTIVVLTTDGLLKLVPAAVIGQTCGEGPSAERIARSVLDHAIAAVGQETDSHHSAACFVLAAA